MSFIKSTKNVATVSIRESGRAIAISARVISEGATLALTGVVALRGAIEQELSEETSTKLQEILSEIDGKLDAVEDDKETKETKPEDESKEEPNNG